MKNFNLFVGDVVTLWRSEKKDIIESAGLKGVSNRQVGDSAEDYILRRVSKISPSYKAVKSKGSQSPSDIFAVANRGRFWHIMLIQVKSSQDSNNIYKLSDSEKKVFSEFAKFVKKQIGASSRLSQYNNSRIIISTGYAGVFVNKENRRHALIEAKHFSSFKRNMSGIPNLPIRLKIALSHGLSPSK